MKKVLPVNYPIITLFPGYAATNAILQSYPQTRDWMFSQYIQTYLYNETNRSPEERPTRGTFFSDFDTRGYARLWQAHAFIEYKWCPFLIVQRIVTEIALREKEAVTSLMKRCIDADFYLFMRLYYDPISELIVPKMNYKHETFIFGYDEEAKKIYMGDNHFVPSNKYKFGVCSYSGIESAARLTLSKFEPFCHEIALIKFDHNAKYVMNYEHVLTQIDAYLRPSAQITKEFQDYVKDTIVIRNPIAYVGNNVYQYLSDFIDEEVFLKKDYVDVRMFHGLYDHKVMMQKRLDYLLETGRLQPNKKELAKFYDEIVKSVLILRNKIIKFNITNQAILLKDVQMLLPIVKGQEYELLNKIFF